MRVMRQDKNISKEEGDSSTLAEDQWVFSPVKDKEMNERKIRELANYLGIKPEDIQCENTYDKYCEYYTEQGTYYVMDEEESREAVKDYIENLILDIGISSFTPEAVDWIKDNALDEDWFEEALREHYQFYAYDIQDEEDEDYENRLVRECIEECIISEREVVNGKYTGKEDLQEMFVEHIMEEIKDYVDEFRFHFGDDELTHIINTQHVLDIEAIVDYCIDADGYGHFISLYDGHTIELDSYYAYFIDNKDRREI